MKKSVIFKIILILSVILMLFCTMQIPKVNAGFLDDIVNTLQKSEIKVADVVAQQETKVIEVASTPTTIDPGDWEPTDYTPADTQKITSVASTIVAIIRVIGIIVMVIVLIVIGIKYMVGSASERAEYKKTMLPYIIGAVIFFSLSQLLALIIGFLEDAGG